MSDAPSLEMSFRSGRPASAYLTLPRRRGDRAERTIPHGPFVVDYAADGRPIGIEIEQVSPAVVPRLKRLLNELGVTGVGPEVLAPLGSP